MEGAEFSLRGTCPFRLFPQLQWGTDAHTASLVGPCRDGQPHWLKIKGQDLTDQGASSFSPSDSTSLPPWRRVMEGSFFKLLASPGSTGLTHPPLHSCQQTPFTSPGWPPKPSTSPSARNLTSGPWAASFSTWPAAPSWM